MYSKEELAELVIKNPEEFKAMRKQDRKTLEELYEYISSNICYEVTRKKI